MVLELQDWGEGDSDMVKTAKNVHTVAVSFIGSDIEVSELGSLRLGKAKLY